MREITIRVSVSNNDEVDELKGFLDDNNYIYELEDSDED